MLPVRHWCGFAPSWPRVNDPMSLWLKGHNGLPQHDLRTMMMSTVVTFFLSLRGKWISLFQRIKIPGLLPLEHTLLSLSHDLFTIDGGEGGGEPQTKTKRNMTLTFIFLPLRDGLTEGQLGKSLNEIACLPCIQL